MALNAGILDPSIILQTRNFATIDPAENARERQQATIADLTIARANAQMADEKRQREAQQAGLARQKQAGALAAKGDYAGADQLALNEGDFDLHGHISGLQDDHRKAIATKLAAAAPLAFQARQLPYEQRKAAIDANAQALVSAGWQPEEIASFDPTDANIDQLVASAQSIDQVLKRHDELAKEQAAANKPIVIDPEGALVTPAGKELYRAAPGTKYITAKPDENVIQVGGEGGASGGGSQRYKNGWAPRARNGGDNTDAEVDGYIAHVSQRLGIDPNQPLPPSAIPRLAQAMAEFESGGKPNAKSVRNRNPGNIRNPDGSFKVYDSPQSGAAAQQALLGRYFKRGQNTVRSIIEGVPASGGGPTVVQRGQAPEATPAQASKDLREQRKTETNLRKEFNNLPQVKSFRTMHGQMGQIAAIGKKGTAATAQDDMALIFSFMKMLDPTSVVREGEYATAQNAAGVPDQVRNSYNRVLSGNRLAVEQRRNMVRSAKTVYDSALNQFNETAAQYQGYASDYGVEPKRVARRFVYGQGGDVPTMTPEQARNAPKGTRFRTTDGRVMVRQ